MKWFCELVTSSYPKSAAQHLCFSQMRVKGQPCGPGSAAGRLRLDYCTTQIPPHWASFLCVFVLNCFSHVWQGHGNPCQYSCLENPMDRVLSGSQQIRLTNTSLGIQFNSNQWQPQTVHLSVGMSRNFWKCKVIILPELTEMIAFSKPGQLHLSSARQSPPPFSIAMVFAPQGEKKAKDGGWVCGMHWEFEVSRCKPVYREWINNNVWLYSTGHSIQYPVINHNGKEYICITESLCCTAEFSTIL